MTTPIKVFVRGSKTHNKSIKLTSITAKKVNNLDSETEGIINLLRQIYLLFIA